MVSLPGKLLLSIFPQWVNVKAFSKGGFGCTQKTTEEPIWYGGSELLPQGRCERHLPPVRSAAGAGSGTGSFQLQ